MRCKLANWGKAHKLYALPDSAERIDLDEFAARPDHVAHQLGEDIVVPSDGAMVMMPEKAPVKTSQQRRPDRTNGGK
jgi:hypothetical protein